MRVLESIFSIVCPICSIIGLTYSSQTTGYFLFFLKLSIIKITSFILFFLQISLFFVSFSTLLHINFVTILLDFILFEKEPLSQLRRTDWNQKRLNCFEIGLKSQHMDSNQMRPYYFGRIEDFPCSSQDSVQSHHLA